MTRSGRLVVISGPSGAGKTSVCRALKRLPGVQFSVSATTRAMRPGEREGVDYHFLTRDEFDRLVASGGFLEWASYNGNFYGTLREPVLAAIAAGSTVLLEIEVAGTRQLREQGVDGLYLFIEPPSLEVLRERLRRRGTNGPEDIEARITIAAQEMVAAREQVGGRPMYDHLILNDDLEQTVRAVQELIRP